MNDQDTPFSGELPCKLCGAPSRPTLERRSALLGRTFILYRCRDCGFIFVGNPCLDYASIYNEEYYRGKGADTLVDYLAEMEHPEGCLRTIEWEGVTSWAREELEKKGSNPSSATILDFGCGNGRLADHLRRNGFPNTVGWDIGWMPARAREFGMPVLSSPPAPGSCDVVIAVEVIEHSADPLQMLREVRSYLKPGGKLLLTTGNAEPWLNKLDEWSYVVPDIHLSYFTPRTLSLALEKTGFAIGRNTLSPAWRQIISYKILKNLHFRHTGFTTRMLSLLFAPLLGRVDKSHGVTAMPHGTAV